MCSYHVSSATNAGETRFVIGDGGELFACGFLDRESVNTYTLNVMAEDPNARHSPATASVFVSCFVLLTLLFNLLQNLQYTVHLYSVQCSEQYSCFYCTDSSERSERQFAKVRRTDRNAQRPPDRIY